MDGHDMFHDGQAEAGAAGLLGTALIHPIKPLEHSLLMFFRDADARVFYAQEGVAFSRADFHQNASDFVVVADGVVAEVVDQLADHSPVGGDAGGDADAGDVHLMLAGVHFQILHTSLRHLI